MTTAAAVTVAQGARWAELVSRASENAESPTSPVTEQRYTDIAG